MPVFFFNDTATTEIYPLSLHDPLPILRTALARTAAASLHGSDRVAVVTDTREQTAALNAAIWDRLVDRKSTRLNSSHPNISYAVFCLKKKHRHRRGPAGAELLSSFPGC